MKKRDMLRFNCRHCGFDADGRARVRIPRTACDNFVPAAWCKFEKRKVHPDYAHSRSVQHYPTVLVIPKDLAEQAGLPLERAS